MNKAEIAVTSKEKILGQLHTSLYGLTNEEVEKRRKQYGFNIFEKTNNSPVKVFFRQFQNTIVYLLLVACIIAFITLDITDGIIITIVLLVNTLLGFSQEYRSERALEKLQALVKHHTLVKRNGKNVTIEEDLLVPGDITILKQGDIIPADCKILETEDVLVNESLLTGESAPVAKSAENIKNISSKNDTLLFAGSIIEKGEAIAVVYATGENTQLGQIAHLSTTTKKITQYGKSIHLFSFLLMKILLATIPIIFIVKLFVFHGSTTFAESLIFIFAFAIAIVPEALPVIVSVTLASGALKLAKRHVLVKEMPALEDLGDITLLCTDKTGTLTEGIPAITHITSSNDDLFQIFAMASIDNPNERRHKYINPYDFAFEKYIPRIFAEKASQYKKLKELPFDPERRRRSLILQDMKMKETYFLVEIGSAESLLESSTTTKKREYLQQIKKDSKFGLRHLAISYKEIQYRKNLDFSMLHVTPSFLGFVTLTDPLRPTTKPTIALAQKLGLTIKILTGDTREVAEYVGKEIGLLHEGEKVYTGNEIEKMNHEELRKIIFSTDIFAKVTPTQKYTIIKLLKEKYVVGYQGDGINDAPSLKLADVAIAVDTATDVAKESADIVLLKKDLGVIVAGINYGRGIFANINKYIKYTMIGNFSSFFTIAVLYLFGTDLPLLPKQLLLTSSFTQVPLLSIAADKVDTNELLRPSRYNIKSLIYISLLLGAITAIFQLGYFLWIHNKPSDFTQTGLFLILTFVQLIVIFSVRNKSFLWYAIIPAPILSLSIVITAAVSLLMTYWNPLQKIFSFIALPVNHLLLMSILLIAYLFLIDIIKVWYYKKHVE